MPSAQEARFELPRGSDDDSVDLIRFHGLDDQGGLFLLQFRRSPKLGVASVVLVWKPKVLLVKKSYYLKLVVVVVVLEETFFLPFSAFFGFLQQLRRLEDGLGAS